MLPEFKPEQKQEPAQFPTGFLPKDEGLLQPGPWEAMQGTAGLQPAHGAGGPPSSDSNQLFFGGMQDDLDLNCDLDPGVQSLSDFPLELAEIDCYRQ